MCKIEGCNRPTKVKARDLCNLHYRRFQRHGDPLAGRVAHGELQRFIAEVAQSDEKTDCITWPYGGVKGSYGSAWSQKYKAMMHPHTQVCEMAHGHKPTEKHEAAHECGNRTCVNPNHIRWATRSENQMDRVKHGTSNRGDAHGMSKLKPSDVHKIREMRQSQRVIAREFGIDQSTVSQIKSGARWAWL